MKHLIATEGKASGTKTLLTVVVLAVVARSFLTGVTVGGFHFGDASAAMPVAMALRLLALMSSSSVAQTS